MATGHQPHGDAPLVMTTDDVVVCSVVLPVFSFIRLK